MAQIMQAYENGGHAYHATMPTDALRAFRDTMLETRDYGFDRLQDAQWALGNAVRTLLADKGVQSVAAEGFGAPGVVVSYTTIPKSRMAEICRRRHADRCRCAAAM